MNILLLHRELVYPGGSETFMLAIAAELKRLNHSVYIYSPRIGLYSYAFLNYCSVIYRSSFLSHYSFDLVISMHQLMVPLALQFSCPKITISNGIQFEESLSPGFDKYISVSNEVFLSNKYLGISSIVLYNSIDLDRFKSFYPVNQTFKNVLLLSNHSPGVVKIVSDACSLFGCCFSHVGSGPYVDTPEYFINTSDLVVTLGRGAIESMACERNVFIFDYAGGDGFVSPKNFSKLRLKNFSGRTHKINYTASQLAAQFLKYDPSLGKKLRALIFKDHNIIDFVSLLLPVKGE